MNEEQREFVEKQMGVSFANVVARVRAQESRRAEDERTEARADINVRDAVEALVESDPQAAKLKGGIREYLADVSASDKADPAKLKRHLSKAVTYAKGKAPSASTPAGDKHPQRRSDAPDGDGGGNLDDKPEPDVKPGRYNVGNNLVIDIQPLPKEVQRRVEKSDHPNGVKMGAGFFEEPRFR